jgi:hypothetical protein
MFLAVMLCADSVDGGGGADKEDLFLHIPRNWISFQITEGLLGLYYLLRTSIAFL